MCAALTCHIDAHSACSGLKRPIFSAGNDLSELYAPATSRDRYKRFWVMSNKFLCSLYLSPLLTVSAIKGACAPAALVQPSLPKRALRMSLQLLTPQCMLPPRLRHSAKFVPQYNYLTVTRS